jgi:predicted aspartyl protease
MCHLRIAVIVSIVICSVDLASAYAEIAQVTVPLIVEGNRPFVDVTFLKADGSTRTARILIDSGGGAFFMIESLAREVGIKWGESEREEGKEFAAALDVPEVSIGGFALKLDARRVAVELGSDNFLPKQAPGRAEGMLPGHVLAKYHVVFDYPTGKFTIAEPGVLTPKGFAIPMPVSEKSGFPRTEIEVDGNPYGFLIDTGASFTMVSDALLKSWSKDHSDWKRHDGAFGDAKTLGGQTLETMIVPQARWGDQTIQEFGMTSQREGVC